MPKRRHGGGDKQPSSTSTHASVTLKFVLKKLMLKDKTWTNSSFYKWSYNTEASSTQVCTPVYKSFTFMSVLYAKDVVIKAQTGGIGGTE